MKQYESSVQKKNYKSQVGGDGGRERGRRIYIYIYILFLLFASFLDLPKSDVRFSSGLKVKLIYAIRATREHQKVGVSTNSVR